MKIFKQKNIKEMREFKKIKIGDNNLLNQEDNIYESNIFKISILIFIFIIFIFILALFLIFKKNININEHQNLDSQKNIIIQNQINQTNQLNEINQLNHNKENQIIKEKYKLLTEKIQEFEKSLRKITQEEIADFRRININGILTDSTKYKRSENPDITIITTLYNQAHCISKAIRSIQNQSLKNIEIIIIDDCSLDNSTEIIEELMKEDERIIFIKHDHRNEGVMITRNEGIRMAKGKYITILDPDDTFIHKDILNYSLHVANMANLDVVEFWSGYYIHKEFKGYYHFHGYDPILLQPELKTNFIKFSDKEKYRPIKC